MSISLTYTFCEVVDVSPLSGSIKIALLDSCDKCCEMLTFSQVSLYVENSGWNSQVPQNISSS